MLYIFCDHKKLRDLNTIEKKNLWTLIFYNMMAKVLVEEEGTGLGGEGRARISPLELCEDKKKWNPKTADGRLSAKSS